MVSQEQVNLGLLFFFFLILDRVSLSHSGCLGTLSSG